MRRFIYLSAALLFTLAFAPVYAQDTMVIDQAVEYIRTQQQSDGSFVGLGASSTADAVYALHAAGENVAEITKDGNSALDYIRSQQQAAATDPGLAAKFLIALLVSGESSPELLQIVEQSYDETTGQYGGDVATHAYALIALPASGQELKTEVVDALKRLQLDDGGWSYDGTAETGSDTNTTALAVQALAAAGGQADAISKAVDYYRTQQNDDGGFPYSQASEFGTDSDANSTAVSIQALVAAGETLDDWAHNGATPLQRLAAFQNDSGAFRYNDTQPEDNPYATYQAVFALAQETLPLAPQTTELPDTGGERLSIVYALIVAAILAAGLLLRRRAA